MQKQNETKPGGIGFLGGLTLLFIGLKLTGYISWPWVWVLSPSWIPTSVLMVLLCIAGIAYLIVNKP